MSKCYAHYERHQECQQCLWCWLILWGYGLRLFSRRAIVQCSELSRHYGIRCHVFHVPIGSRCFSFGSKCAIARRLSQHRCDTTNTLFDRRAKTWWSAFKHKAEVSKMMGERIYVFTHSRVYKSIEAISTRCVTLHLTMTITNTARTTAILLIRSEYFKYQYNENGDKLNSFRTCDLTSCIG